MRDPYQLLGVSRTASQDDIKRAYRRLVKELHPDVNPGDSIVESRFKEVSAAYRVLVDPDARARYDRGEIDGLGRARPARPFRRGFGGRGVFDDLFRRNGAQAPVKTRGADVGYRMEVAFLDAVLGCRQRLTLSDGSGIDVTVPPGTGDGDTLRLKGRGLAGLGGGAAGDAMVEITVKPHRLFTRNGHDIHLDVPVTLPEAVLGGPVEVPTVDGRVTVRVPPGASSGLQLRLRGKGVPRGNGSVRGDQYVRLLIVLPDRHDEALARFAAHWRPAGVYQPRRKAGLD
jgi:DnaJ-class molecular chaperone